MTIDLKKRRIKITGYLILTFANDYGFGQIKNWVIEVSDDKNAWIEIDCHEDDEIMKNSSFCAFFKVQKS